MKPISSIKARAKTERRSRVRRTRLRGATRTRSNPDDEKQEAGGRKKRVSYLLLRSLWLVLKWILNGYTEKRSTRKTQTRLGLARCDDDRHRLDDRLWHLHRLSEILCARRLARLVTGGVG